MADQVQLYGRIFITGNILAVTGLHIGGSGGSFSIGGNDNPVIYNALTGEPYIPGSSLRGKMRSLTEKYREDAKLGDLGGIRIHRVNSREEYEASPIANIYGVSAEGYSLPTRLIVRDVFLTDDSRERLRKSRTDLPYTEVKTEVTIDRVTSAAMPRSIERVPPSAVFGPMELVYNVYQQQDIDWFSVLVDGMMLLEDDYLGGAGSRGSGKVRFDGLTVTLKRRGDYRNPNVMGTVNQLSDLSQELATIQQTAKDYMFGT